MKSHSGCGARIWNINIEKVLIGVGTRLTAALYLAGFFVDVGLICRGEIISMGRFNRLVNIRPRDRRDGPTSR